METFTITKSDYYYTDVRKAINVLINALRKAVYIKDGDYASISYNSKYRFERNVRTYKYRDWVFSGPRIYIGVDLNKNDLIIETDLSLDDLKNLKYLEDYKDLHRAIKEAAKESLTYPPSKRVQIWVQPRISRTTQY